jgi:hypothetical protein
MMRHLLIASVAVLPALAANSDPNRAPLFFIENHGQAPRTVRYMAQGSGLTAYFLSDEAVFRGSAASFRLRFPGSSPSVRLEGSGPLAARANFLTGPEEEWRIGVPLYSSVVYRGLYPGIDMIYGANGRRLKSEFMVAPGADPARIQLRYLGGELRLDSRGELVLSIDGHELREEAPVLYQERNGKRETVEGRYTLTGDGTVGFIVNDYDRSLPLVIDPTLSYSTLLGGSNSDSAMALAVDSTGAAYIAGFTASYNLPTANPQQNFNAGNNDVFVAKLNAAGNGLVYCTYIGGKGDDRAYAIAVDANGLAYLAGYTTSTNFPLRSPLQTRLAGDRNAFVLKLSALGNGLVFSTYLGGDGSDTAYGIALDASGNAYVAGDTTSITFPPAGKQIGKRGSQDAFVAKISADGSRLIYNTALGGASDDHAAAIALDTGGDAYVTGSTWSTDFPVAGAAQNALAGGQDAFVVKLAADGSSLLFGTFLGGAGGAIGYPESGQGIAVDSQGNAYIAGVTGSSDFPLLHPLQAAKRGSSTDAFAAKFTSAGTLVYSTYLGGSGMDAANAIAVDAAGNAYVAGQTFSSDLPVINAVQGASGGDYDAFWAIVNPSGDSLAVLSYLGGNSSDTASAIALDASGAIYLAGWTLSTNFPVLNGYQSTNAGNYGAFLTKIGLGGMLAAVGVTPNSGTGASQTFSFQFSDNAGAADLTAVSILVNSAAALANACSVTYNRASNTLALATDAGALPSGAITPGSGSQQNSQCTLNGADSSVTSSGTVLTLNLSLAFQPSFAGAKNVYLQAANASGSTGWQQRGAWTIPAASGPPAAVSVTPASGNGLTQTFAFAFSDGKGYAAIVSAQILINTPMTGTSGCYLLYQRASNSLYLTNDAATVWQTPVTLGQSGTLQNSQCSVNSAASSVTASGTSLTLNLALTFQSAFAGSRDIYMEVYDGTEDSGWQQRGTWTVPASGPPAAVSVTPASGSGASQTFAFAFSDPGGYAAIVTTQIVINSALSTSGGCYFLYQRASNALYLSNDAGSAWQSPVTPGQNGAAQNSQCSVDAAASSVTATGTSLTLNLAIGFQSAFAGAQNVYMEVYDGAGDSGWQQRGAWTVTGNGSPSAVSVSPASGAGVSQAFAFTFADPAGYAAIVTTQIVINSALSTSGACYLLYQRASNSLYMTNDAGSAWQDPVTPGQSGTLQNSQCSVNSAASSVTASGTTLTLNLAVTFSKAFAGAKNVYMEVYDGAADSGWQQRGAWTIPADGPPTADSVAPASGAGSTQVFTFQYSDPAGYAAISSSQILINSTLAAANGCYLLYYRPNNAIYLTNDPGTAWQTPVNLGTAGTLQNSQCSVNTAASSVSGAGNTLTLTLSLTFKPAFSGARNVYMEVYDGAGDSGWQQRGAWTVP